MPTSAKDRLNKLFAHTPLPPKPQPDQFALNQAETREAESQLERVTEASTAPQNLRSNQTLPQYQASAHDIVTTSHDDGENYVAAFSKKPKMKVVQPQSTVQPKPDMSNQIESESVERNSSSNLVSERKQSLPQKLGESDSRPLNTKSTMGTGKTKVLMSQFCVFSLVLKFPYKYMDDVEDCVSQKFFAGGKIYSRTWNLHYIHLPESFATGPVLLVPFDQVQTLVNEISTTFGIKASVPPFPFTLPFYKDGTPQPVFLGVSTSRQSKDDLQVSIPESPLYHGEAPREASQELRKAFEEWYERCEAIKLITKKSKTKTKGRHQLTAKGNVAQVKRVQCYFGLRPSVPNIELVDGLSWDVQQERIQEILKQSLVFDFLQTDKPAPYGFEGEPIIICIDVEAYERDHSLVTEVGVSTLDTMDLVDVAPGLLGDNWIKHIRSRHFWIKGREQLTNKDFVHGCPQSFQFGQTERVGLDEVVEAVDSCFQWPFSVQYKHNGQYQPQSTIPEKEALNMQKSEFEDPSLVQRGLKERNIIFLGHDGMTDIAYLSQLGSTIFGPSDDNELLKRDTVDERRRHVLTSILEAIDTSTLFKTIQSDTQTKSLASLCSHLGIDAWSLHNAGNDARYTLEVLVKIAIKSRQLQDEYAREIEPTSHTHMESPSEVARSRYDNEKMAQARQDLKDEFRALDEARIQGVSYPALAGATFRGGVPVLLKKRAKRRSDVGNQDFINQDGSVQQWNIEQSAKTGNIEKYFGDSNVGANVVEEWSMNTL